VKFGVIVDVEASRAIRQAEVGAAKTMIERTEERFGLKPERLVGDTAYGAAPMLNWLVEEKGIAPHIPVFDKSKRDDGTFWRSDFRYDPTGDVYHCPGGKRLGTSGTVHEGKTLLYRASKLDCDLCPPNRNAAQRNHRARSRAISMSTPETSPGRSLAPRVLSSRDVSGRRSRCGSTTVRGGLLRSSDEAAVMVVERRGWAIDEESGQLATGGARSLRISVMVSGDFTRW
jgi:hypothetical protein